MAPADRPISMMHVFPAFQYGGQQTRLSNIVHGLGDGFRHVVISLSDDISAAGLFEEAAPATVESMPMKKSAAVSPRNIRRLMRRIRQSKPDILCTYNWGSLEAVIANRLGPRLAHLHFEDGFGSDESIDRQKKSRVLARRFILGGVDIVVPSKTLHSLARECWRLPGDLLHYIPNGVDLDRFASQSLVRRDGGSVTVGSVGALRREKNYARLIRAAASLGPTGLNLEIAGDGPELSYLRAKAEEQGLSAAAVFSGYTPRPEKAYERFDIFALSSDTEQMPISLLEAMAAGLPVLATDVGDVKDIVAEENRALVTARGDEQAYAEALGGLVRDRELRVRLGAANAEKVKREFGLEKMIAAHERLYRAVASRQTADGN